MAVVIGSVVGIILYVLGVIGMWRMFRKAGRMGWPSIIPVVNTAFLCLVGWKKIWPFILEIVAAIVGILLLVLGYYVMAIHVLIDASGSAGGSVALMVIGIILIIVAVVVSIIVLHRVSKAFGHRAGFTVGMIFVPFIIFPIIGLGPSEYIDKKEPEQEPEPAAEPEAESEPEPAVEPEAESEPEPAVEPEAESEAESEPESTEQDEDI